jgi:hypothetical protein
MRRVSGQVPPRNHRQQHFTGVSGHLGGQLRIGQAHRISIADHRRHATTGGSHPEVFVDLADGHRSLTDRRRHPFHRATAHVTRREHTGLAGFQHPRLAPGPATFFTVAIRVQRGRAGRDEAVVVELDGAGEPRRVGHGTDEDEQRPRSIDWRSHFTMSLVLVPHAAHATRPRSCHRLGPLDLPFKSKRYRHGSVAVPVVSRGGFIAVGSSRQRAQP